MECEEYNAWMLRNDERANRDMLTKVVKECLRDVQAHARQESARIILSSQSKVEVCVRNVY